MKYLIFILVILILSCANEQNRPEESEKVSTEKLSTVKGQESEEVTNQTLTMRNWKVDLVLDNGKINEESEWKGNVLSFSNEGTFTWKGEGFENKGNYLLDQENSIISLEAKQESITSEWSIKYRANMMVWIGSPAHGHQAYQLKLVSFDR